MKVEKVKAEITNVNPRGENSENGKILASDISVRFAVPRAVIDTLFPCKSFTNQFYAGDDTILECVCPITYIEKIKDLRIDLHIGLKPMKFEKSSIAAKMKLTPLAGQYIEVKCKLQVHPSPDQSGKIDASVDEWIDIEVAPMTEDMLAAVA